MKRCIVFQNNYYIRLAIQYGYNSGLDGSIDVFKELIKSEHDLITQRYKIILNLLLENGFDKHGQSVLLYCVDHGSIICLRKLFHYGVNFYSIRNEIHTAYEYS